MACDLELDSLAQCQETQKWAWLRRYCMAARVANALQYRTDLPPTFIDEVRKKIQEISVDGEGSNSDHENHVVFTSLLDEQLLLWLNRYVILHINTQSGNAV